MQKSSPGITIIAVLIFWMLYVPLFCVAQFSFNSSRVGLDWGGFTLDWYVKLFHNEEILNATINTLILCGSATLVSTILGTCLAIGLYRFPWGKKTLRCFDLLLHLPVVTPDIIFAVALVIAFSALRALTGLFELGMMSMIVGHITFQVAFVALSVRGRIELIGSDIEEAAYDLYADHKRVLFKVLLPLLKPGIIAGGVLAFTLSLNDFVISFFTAGPKSTTLPLFIYSAMRRGVTPEIHALSTILMIGTILAVSVMHWFTTRKDSNQY